MRDIGGYDRIYHLNRVMMAAGMSNGKNAKTVKMDGNSWAEKYNTAHPYTDEENNKMKSALKTVGSDVKSVVSDRRSMELPSTNVKSSTATIKRNQYGV